MLRPSRPMIRPFMSSLGSGTTETVVSATWLEAVRWMQMERMSLARRSPSCRASLLNGPNQLGHVVPDFVFRALEQQFRGLIPGHPGDLFQLPLLLGPRGLRLLDHLAVVSLAVGDRLLPTGQVLLDLIQSLLPAEQTVLKLRQLLAPLLGLRLDLRAKLMEFILQLQPRFPLR